MVKIETEAVFIGAPFTEMKWELSCPKNKTIYATFKSLPHTITILLLLTYCEKRFIIKRLMRW